MRCHTVLIVQTNGMHARDAAIMGATLRQIRTTGIVDAGNQTSSFEGRHGRSFGAITGFRIIRRQAIFDALQHNDKTREKNYEIFLHLFLMYFLISHRQDIC